MIAWYGKNTAKMLIVICWMMFWQGINVASRNTPEEAHLTVNSLDISAYSGLTQSLVENLANVCLYWYNLGVDYGLGLTPSPMLASITKILAYAGIIGLLVHELWRIKSHLGGDG